MHFLLSRVNPALRQTQASGMYVPASFICTSKFKPAVFEVGGSGERFSAPCRLESVCVGAGVSAMNSLLPLPSVFWIISLDLNKW